MIEQLNFDSWLQSFVPEDPEYYAIYDPETYAVTGIYPEGSAKEKSYKIKIDPMLAEEINSGKISLNSCVANPLDNEITISNSSKYKNEKYFHQIKSNVSTLNLPTLTLRYLKNQKELCFVPSESLKEHKEIFSYIKEYNFYITAKNDPDLLYQIINVSHEEIFEQNFSVKLNIDLEKYSIFTKKIFKNYFFSVR
jgi:hypothetical protein